MKVARLIILLSIPVMLTGSCTEEPPLNLPAQKRAELDTLYARQVRVLRPRLDSLCEAMREEELNRTVDSLLRVRRAEELRLRKRIPKR